MAIASSIVPLRHVMHVAGADDERHHAAATAEPPAIPPGAAPPPHGLAGGRLLLAVLFSGGRVGFVVGAPACREDANDSGQCQCLYQSNHVRCSQWEAGRVGGGGISCPCERASSAAAR